MSSPRTSLMAFSLAAAALTCLATAAPAQIEIAALSGDATPEGTHVFKSFGLPIMAPDGSLTFSFDTPDFGPFAFSGILHWGAGELVTVGDENTPVPGGAPGEVFSLLPSTGPSQNGQGTLAFKGRVGVNETVLMRQAPGSPPELLGRDGEGAPDGNGTVEYGDGFVPTVNAGGSIAVSASMFSTTGGTTDDQGILRFDGAGSPPMFIVRKGDPAPGGGSFAGQLGAGFAFPDPSMNSTGDVAFAAATAFGETGVFVGNGGSQTAIARTFDLAPGTGGTQALNSFSLYNPINDSGDVAFAASFVSGGGFRALYRGDGVSTITLAMLGDPAPTAGGGVNGTYLLFGSQRGLNSGGQVAFSASTVAAALSFPGLFVATPGSSDTCIMRNGQTAPGGDTFLRVEEFAMNDGGQLAFHALLSPPVAADYRALYLWSPGSGLSEVIREGDPLAGSTVSNLALSGSVNAPAGARDRMGLNNAGDIAFRFVLSDNRLGIATTAPGAAPTWVDEGCALAGTLGDPVLSGSGTLAAGSNNTVTLTNGAPSAIAGLFFGLTSLPLSFKGGTLKPDPLVPPVILSLPANGQLALPFVMPAGAPAGTTLWSQWVIQDTGGVSGFALSNALKGVTP